MTGAIVAGTRLGVKTWRPSQHTFSMHIGRRTSAILLAVSFPCAFVTAQAQRPTRAALQRTVDSLVASALRAGPVAAMSVAVVRGRDTIVMKGLGGATIDGHAFHNTHA